MKRALILGGGGALAAAYVGNLTALAEGDIHFDIVGGVSSGALIGGMYAQGDLDGCRDVWHSVREEDVHHKYSAFSIGWRLLIEKRKALYNPRGLRNLVKQHININKTIMPFYMGVCSLYDKQYYSLTQEDFDTNEAYTDAVLASALMPIVWEPIPEIRTKKGIIRSAVDGGLRNNTPLGDILKEEPDEIYIIQSYSGIHPLYNPENIMQVAKATFLDTVLSEVVDNDTEQLLMINAMVQAEKGKGNEVMNPKTGRPFKCFKVVQIRPQQPLGDNLDFSRKSLDWRFKLGYEQIMKGF